MASDSHQVLTEMGLPQGAGPMSLLAFNLGVESGQLAVVLAIMPLAYFLRATHFYRRAVMPWGSSAIACLVLFLVGASALLNDASAVYFKPLARQAHAINSAQTTVAKPRISKFNGLLQVPSNGTVAPHAPTDPYEFLVWWHCEYPASRERCSGVGESLTRDIGIAPGRLWPSRECIKLVKALKSGSMVPEVRAARLKEIAGASSASTQATFHQPSRAFPPRRCAKP